MDERHLLSSRRARFEAIATGVGGALTAVAVIATALGSGPHDVIDDLGFAAGGLLLLIGFLAIARWGFAAPRLWATNDGIELESGQGALRVPWRHVSRLHTSRWPVWAFDLLVEGRLRRFRFVPCEQCDEWVEYFRSGGTDDDVSD